MNGCMIRGALAFLNVPEDCVRYDAADAMCRALRNRSAMLLGGY